MKTVISLIGICYAVLSVPALAAPIIYTEYSPYAYGLTGSAEADFVSSSGALEHESFENVPLSENYYSPTALTSVTLDGFTAQAEYATRLQISNGSFGGNHAAVSEPDSFSQFMWVVDSGLYSVVTLNFNQPVNEFALTITDAKETGGFSIETDSGFNYSPLISGTDGNELFFGMIDYETAFTSVTLRGHDPFGVDAVYYSSVSSVPLPAAVWMFFSGLLVLGGMARKRSQ